MLQDILHIETALAVEQLQDQLMLCLDGNQVSGGSVQGPCAHPLDGHVIVAWVTMLPTA